METQDIVVQLKFIFLDELAESLERFEEAFKRFRFEPKHSDNINELFRYFHNIKGSSRSVDFVDLAGMAHRAESLLAEIQAGLVEPKSNVVDEFFKTFQLMLNFLINERNQDSVKTCAEIRQQSRVLACLSSSATVCYEALNPL